MKNLTKKITIFAGMFACAASGIALAEPIEEKNLQSGKDQITADNGYIFMYGEDRFSGVFLKLPNADDIAEYEADWEEEFTKAREKYERKIASYERDVERARGSNMAMPEEPFEPTAENFGIDPIELRNIVSFGPQYVYAKGKSKRGKTFSYLEQVEPGTYVYYGPIAMSSGAAPMGHCLCMGSIQFEVKPGIITNVGEALQIGGNITESMNFDHDGAAIATGLEPYPIKYVDYDLPEYLQQYESEIADFRASKKYPNYFGIAMERMRPMEGILAYERDQPIDVKTEPAKVQAEAAKAEAARAEGEAAVAAIEAALAEATAIAAAANAKRDAMGAQDIPASAETASEQAVAEAAQPE